MDKRTASGLEVAKKALARTPVKDLLSRSVLSEAIDRVLQADTDSKDIDRTSYAAVLFRQITAALTGGKEGDTNDAVELIYQKLGPVLQPRGTLSAIIMREIANPVRPHALRATEALTAAAKLGTVLPPLASTSRSPTFLLSALFHDILRDGLGPRYNVTAISIICGSVPYDEIPGDLVDRLLVNLLVDDTINVRCNTVVTILTRRLQRVPSSFPQKEKYKLMLKPIVSYFASSEADEEGKGLQLLTRYLLPPLFKEHRDALPVFLEMLDSAQTRGGPDYFAAWVATASHGVSSGIVNISVLPLDRIQQGLSHEDYKIRIGAFELVSRNKSVLEPTVMALVKESFMCNLVVPSPSARTDMASAVYAYLNHLKEFENAITREAKRAKVPEDAARFQQQLVTASNFHDWYLDSYLEPSIAECRNSPAMRPIFALKLLRLYLDVYGDRASILAKVFTPRRVSLLIACQASEFAETRSQARHVIARAPLPLAGFETLTAPTTQTLLVSARTSINHPRKTQAEAGRAAVSIVFSKVVLPQGDEAAVAFLTEMVDTLEHHVIKCEENIVTGIDEYPMHGLLSAIEEVVQSLDLDTPERQAVWKAVLHRLYGLVERVWTTTSQVISLGTGHDDDDTNKGTAAHEIARAYEVLGDADEGDGGDELDHTNLLSGSWRATKEAAELLAVMITVPLKCPQQVIWSAEEVNGAGRLFLTWMHDIRHRGTFSRIAPALQSVVEAVKARKEMAGLVDDWLQNELLTVKRGQMSTLRRSAGLPYSTLALVTANRRLLNVAVDALVDMARVDNKLTSDVTKVHAMNVLKIVLLDAKQSRLFPEFFEAAVMVALEAFTSENWNVRNVGLLLFSTLAQRSLSTGKSQEASSTRAALLSRQTLWSWHSRYPSIIPHITVYLRHAYRQGPATLTEHSPLFPILIIVRSLRWSDEGHDLAAKLFTAVEHYLGNTEWFVRQVASQALASLLSPTAALEKAKVVSTQVCHDTDDYNTLHGRLLFLKHLFSDTINWNDVENADKKQIESRLRDMLQVWSSCDAAVIPMAILDCVCAYAMSTRPVSISMLPEAKRQSLALLRARPTVHQNGLDLLHESAAKTVILSPVAAQDIAALLQPSIPEDAQLAALDFVERTPSAQTPELLGLITSLCVSSSGNAVRTKVCDVLAAWGPTSQAEAELKGLEESLWTIVRRTRCVPLREAALGALGRAISHTAEDRIAELAQVLLKTSDENRSEPARASALHCIEHLTPVLFDLSSPISPATRVVLHRTLIRLAEDDDIDIRLGAAEVIERGLGLSRPVEQRRVVGLWWKWVAERALAERDAWEAWLWDTVADAQGTEADLSALAAGANRGAVGELFVEEEPNMFRNPVDDCESASEILSQLTGGNVAVAALEQRVSAALAAAAGSPIDATWAARQRLERRRDAMVAALSTASS